MLYIAVADEDPCMTSKCLIKFKLHFLDDQRIEVCKVQNISSTQLQEFLYTLLYNIQRRQSLKDAIY